MRADPRLERTAADIVNSWKQDDLRDIFTRYGEESEAGRVAAAIVRRRSREPFLTADDLGRFVFGVKTKKGSRSSVDPATRVFQALRIAVNHELENLQQGLEAAMRALRPGGRVAFVCWRPLAENPWLLVPLGAAAQHMQLPPPPAPGAPGPFAFADPERVRGILDQAGFDGIKLEPVNDTLTVGGAGLDEAVHFLLEGVGPTSAALRDADPAVRPRVFAAVREALAPFVTPEGVRMPAAAWVVTATSAGA